MELRADRVRRFTVNTHLEPSKQRPAVPLSPGSTPLATITTERRGAVLIVRLVGEVDLSNADAVMADVERLVDVADRCVLDCTELTHVSAAGIRALLATGARRVSEGGRVRIVAPPDGVMGRVLHVVSPDPGIPIDRQTDEATERLAQASDHHV